MPERFAVLGSGAWGIAVACHLARQASTRVTLFAARPATAAWLLSTRENNAVLSGVRVPEAVTVTADPAAAMLDADHAVVAIPTIHLVEQLERFRRIAPPRAGVVSLTKGLENTTFRRPTQIAQSVWPDAPVAVLSGPSHAEEVARGLPTSLVVAAAEEEYAARLQEQMGSDRIRLYTSPDAVGVELAGALKNVIGLAAGVSDGLGFGDNAKAALVTRGLAEITRFGVALGAEAATFAGLAGQGDLIATCFSRHGRNRRAGEQIARGASIADLVSGPQIIEGINTVKSVIERNEALKLDLPIMQGVHDIVHGGVDPQAAVQALMARKQRREERW